MTNKTPKTPRSATPSRVQKNSRNVRQMVVAFSAVLVLVSICASPFIGNAGPQIFGSVFSAWLLIVGFYFNTQAK